MPSFAWQVVLETETKNGKTTRWAGLSGPLLKNEHAQADIGQLKFAGLTDAGEIQYNQHLETVRNARKDAVKKAFERAHLTWYKDKHGIVMNDYESEMIRRANANPKAGIAQDTPQELEYDDKHLFDDSDGDADGSDDE